MEISPNLKSQIYGKTIIITGCSYGLGRTLSKCFVEYGASVVGIDKFNSDDQFEMNASNFTFYKVDISREDEVIDCFHDIFRKFGSSELLINNAAINFRPAPITTVTEKQLLEIFSVNVFGAIYCSREYSKYAVTVRYGNILNVSSNAAMKGNMFETPYTSTKWALRGITLSLAHEFAQQNIAVNEIEPGVPIHTPMSETVYDDETKKRWIEPSILFPAFVYIGLQTEGNRKSGQHVVASELLGLHLTTD